MISHVAVSLVNITEDVRTLNFLTNHIAITHKPRLVKEENRSHISSNPNNTKSTNAVIFANAANQKKSHAIKTYFNTSFLSLDSLF
jgi:ABC-type dipeptide/oligopeptide/nickel transport system ATPase component